MVNLRNINNKLFNHILMQDNLPPTIQSAQPLTSSNQETGLGFALRDKTAKAEEEQGIIEFPVYTNDRYFLIKEA